jgi:type IV secretion system protein TrbL
VVKWLIYMSILNQIAVEFNNAIAGWQVIGIQIAKQIFVVLAIIQLIWCAILWMMNRNNPDEALIEFIKKMLFLSVFWQILTNYDRWVPNLINSLRDVGHQMTGSATIYPADIYDKGINLASLVFNNSIHFGWGENIISSLMAFFVACIIFLAFTRIAIEMILILIGSKIILVGGLIMLGFASSQWTYKYAERYFSTAINFGIKMLFITLIIGLGETLSSTLADHIRSATAQTLVSTYFSIIGAVLTYLYLSLRIPDMAAAMLTGEALSIGFPGAISSGFRAARNTINAGQVATAAIQTAGGNIASGTKATSQYLKKKNAESSEYIKKKFPKSDS